MTVARADLTLLVLDRDSTLRELLENSLRFAGYTVVTAGDVTEALDLARSVHPHLIIMDTGLSGLNRPDLEFAGDKAEGDDGLIFFTTSVSRLENVADVQAVSEYLVTKPFSLHEVIAQVEAALRSAGLRLPPEPGLLVVGDLNLYEGSRLAFRGGRQVRLSAVSFAILHYLAINEGIPLSSEQIVDHVWGAEIPMGVAIVEPYIAHLRRKLDDTLRPLIHVLPGVGYMLRIPEGV
ncbi:MAG TPA: response regulator transcription factor [Kineosporiaceae bacterium]